MNVEPPLPDKIVAIDDALDADGIAHAFGGALALAYYAEPRATIDIDLNVFIDAKRLGDIHARLAPLGVGGEVVEHVVERDGQCRLWWGQTPIDLFFAYDAIHDAMRRGLRRVSFGESTLPILAPEHLAVCKAVFDRAKDWIDIEQMLVATDWLDVGEVDDWLGRIVGHDDRRRDRFRTLAEQLRGGWGG